tara:strand:- start:29170 stop:29868 length:699 start_codon:yes stop_codon:yes gene_type:complete
MKIEFKGNTISNLADWQKFVFVGKKAKGWKEDRSASSLANFIINNNGEEKINCLVSAQINEAFTLEVAYPEYQTRFDKYGQGREHDLAIFGKTDSGKKTFIGVEAKVDESFGATVASEYHTYKAKELNGKNTNLPKRIEELLKFNFKIVKASDFKLRYQLLYATAGTLSIDADIHILLILVFKTAGYKPKVGAKNYKDLQAFLKKAEAVNVDDNTYQLNMNNKVLTLIYKEI